MDYSCICVYNCVDMCIPCVCIIESLGCGYVWLFCHSAFNSERSDNITFACYQEKEVV